MRIRISSGTGAPAVELEAASVVILTDEGNPVAAAVANNEAVIWTTCREPEFMSFIEDQGLTKRKALKMRLGGTNVSQQNARREAGKAR